jgi:cell division transport system permease protein
MPRLALLRGGDLPLTADAATRYLPWVLGLMVYLATLALAGALALDTLSERWHVGLAGTLTVQLAAPADGRPESRAARRDQALALLRAAPEVASAEPLDDAAVDRLLAPWLGDIAGTDLPLPDLIAVTLRPGAEAAAPALAERLSAALPEVTLDDHKRWLADFLGLLGTARLVAAILLGLVIAAAVTSVVFVTRTGLAIHRPVIDIVHLIGATDGYIAREFQAHAFRLGLLGGLGGLALAAFTLLLIGWLVSGVAAALLPPLRLAGWQWALLALLPLAAALLALATARWTVLRSLRRTP